MKTHELKLDDKYFGEVKSGKKNFEIRKNDRNFQVGDVLELRRWDGVYVKGDLMNVKKQEADTLKVRVTWMLDQFENTNKWKAALKYLMDASNEKADDTAEKISEVLEQYFHTNHLPDDYVVLGTEVVK